MKILMVSMPSLHFFRWVSQLEGSGFDIYWFDITGSGYHSSKMEWLTQRTDWRLKFDYPGRYWVKSKLPFLYQFIRRFNENNLEKEFETYLELIKPDVVHSFALYVSCTPIISVMENYPSIKWIYSSWGSDLYARRLDADGLAGIKRTLPRVDYMFNDCNRDKQIAIELGFKGEVLGVFPGGGGFHLDEIDDYFENIDLRNIILVKGYQGRYGRCNEVLKALLGFKNELIGYKIVVFGADTEVLLFAEMNELTKQIDIEIFSQLNHNEVLKLMGKSKIYIGFSESDGMPNTLLEAICSGCFPLQSNPGGASEDVIVDGVNGLLLTIDNLNEQIGKVLKSGLCKPGVYYNLKNTRPIFDYEYIQMRVLESYCKVKSAL